MVDDLKTLIGELNKLIKEKRKQADYHGNYGTGICDPAIAQEIRSTIDNLEKIINKRKPK